MWKQRECYIHYVMCIWDQTTWQPSPAVYISSLRTGPPGNLQIRLVLPKYSPMLLRPYLGNRSITSTREREVHPVSILLYFISKRRIFIFIHQYKTKHRVGEPSSFLGDVTQVLYGIKEVTISTQKSNFLMCNLESIQPYQNLSSGMHTHGSFVLDNFW